MSYYSLFPMSWDTGDTFYYKNHQRLAYNMSYIDVVHI